jgi:hypothetical protein
VFENGETEDFVERPSAKLSILNPAANELDLLVSLEATYFAASRSNELLVDIKPDGTSTVTSQDYGEHALAAANVKDLIGPLNSRAP